MSVFLLDEMCCVAGKHEYRRAPDKHVGLCKHCDVSIFDRFKCRPGKEHNFYGYGHPRDGECNHCGISMWSVYEEEMQISCQLGDHDWGQDDFIQSRKRYCLTCGITERSNIKANGQWGPWKPYKG